jgi:multisubunit Na+/H+ antiporter MnhF subunit
METVVLATLYAALAVHILLMVVVAWRLWRGENVIDRLMASEMLSTLALAVLVLLTLIHGQRMFIDVGLGLAALGYVTIVTFCKYIADKRMF